jgi:putative nucleotidyltransferase with HDIG domain
MAPNNFRHLSLGTRIYVGTIVIAGAGTIAQSFYDLTAHPIGWQWATLAILTLLSGSATVRLPSLPATISVSETFVFTSVLLFGSAAGTLTVALDALVISFWSYRKGHPFYKIVFNVCALPLTIWTAAHIFFLFPEIEPLIAATHPESIRLKTLIGPLLIFTIVYFALNSWIITYAISLERRLRAFTIWRENFLWLSLNYFGGASVAALFVSYTRDLDYTYLVVIVPLLIVLYFTFSMSMGRVDDANRHLTQLNALYMSTIETLAMAIDAKDQITHGHIRRVQSYAIRLAQEVGVTDTALIKAVEAAALLHDMGKLAVPEYILNKPGPLTPAEFEKMKLHASVGADILSSIEFPYPVVPIVRHHHENWNGTGYPDGLQGTSIPIGARILAVVDCFDALTSDRPYRPRLTDKEAVDILVERRGSMYDPLVVDTFLRIYRQILPAPTHNLGEVSLSAIVEASSAPPRSHSSARHLDEITGSSEEMLTLFDLARGLSSPTHMHHVGEVVSRHLKRLIPCSMCVLFLYDSDSDELVATHSFGDNSSVVSGIRIGMGQHLSGWVGAHRRSIRNSDPVLDLGDVARNLSPRPRSCLSVPLVAGKELIGVITVYSTSVEAFSEEHQRLLETVARQIAPLMGRDSLRRDATAQQSEVVVELPHIAHMPLHTASISSVGNARSTAVLRVELNRTIAHSPRTDPTQERTLRRLGAVLQKQLRSGDLLFREDEAIVIIVLHVDLKDAEAVAVRIHRVLSADDLVVKSGSLVNVEVATLGVQDGPLDTAVRIALQGMKRNRRRPGPNQGSPTESIH